jgi:hypothetical protein
MDQPRLGVTVTSIADALTLRHGMPFAISDCHFRLELGGQALSWNFRTSNR